MINKDGMTTLWLGTVLGKLEWGSSDDPFPLGTNSLRTPALTLTVASIPHAYLFPIRAVHPEVEPISCYFPIHFLMVLFDDPTLQITSQTSLYQSQEPFSTPKFLLLPCQTLMHTYNRLASCSIQILVHPRGHHLPPCCY